MKKWITLSVLCLVVFSFTLSYAGDYTRHSATEIKRTRGDDYEGRDSFRINDNTSSGNSCFRVDRNGNVWILNTDGVTTWQFVRDRYVYIDDVADLSTWSGAAAGSSYFQMEAGKTYIVDPVAIVATGTAPTSGVSTEAWSGVTAHLPLATDGSNMQDVTVMYGRASSGTSASPISFEVEIWPAPLAGTTKFRADGAVTGSQNLAGFTTSGTSTMAIGVTGVYGLNDQGKSMTFKLFYNSAVSAQMINNFITQ